MESVKPPHTAHSTQHTRNTQPGACWVSHPGRLAEAAGEAVVGQRLLQHHLEAGHKVKRLIGGGLLHSHLDFGCLLTRKVKGKVGREMG